MSCSLLLRSGVPDTCTGAPGAQHSPATASCLAPRGFVEGCGEVRAGAPANGKPAGDGGLFSAPRRGVLGARARGRAAQQGAVPGEESLLGRTTNARSCPDCQAVSTTAIAKATGSGSSSASRWKRGLMTPRPRLWSVLASTAAGTGISDYRSAGDGSPWDTARPDSGRGPS